MPFHPFSVILVAPRTPRKHNTGIENYVLRVSEYLKKKNVPVQVWGTGKKEHTFSLHEIPMHEFKGYAPGDAYYLSPALYFALKKTNASMVHANGFNNLTSIACMLAKKPGDKLVITMNSSAPSTLVRKLLRKPFELLFRLLAHRLDKVVCVSENELNLFREMLPIPKERFALIPNGVEVKEFEKLHVKKKSGQIILIGRMVKNKGHARVLRALPLVVKERRDVQLHLVGDGVLRPHLETLAVQLGVKEHVHFHGNIPFSERETLMRLLKESECMVLLSDYEGNALVFSEALAAKTAMVLTDKGVMHEYVASKKASGVIDPDNPKMVAQTLISVLKNPAEFIYKGGPPTSWEEVGEALMLEYNSLLHEKR